METEQGENLDKKEAKKDEAEFVNLGLSTGESLNILQRDIKRVIEEYEAECKKTK